MPTRYDILIIGGGPAGSTTAALLAMNGSHVALCEGKTFPREKVCGEFMGTRLRPILDRLGLLDTFDQSAGPPVTDLIACSPSGAELTGQMPADHHGALPRAMSRASFDHMLLDRAQQLGATILQPSHVTHIERAADSIFHLQTSTGPLHARTVIFANGTGPGAASLPREFVCFKAHFDACSLPPKTIAIGGAAGLYVGLVQSSANRHSLAFVTRRHRIKKFGNSADAQLAALLNENPGFRRMMRTARRAGPWMASGPLAPGPRTPYAEGQFCVGNAAGEVHALVGEGITLAMRSAEILADTLHEHGLENLARAGQTYETRWRKEFHWRCTAANLFANLIMRPPLAALASSVLETWPELLTPCLRHSGK